MKKSISKRLKITKTGKVLRRQMAIGHFRSKKSGQKRQSKKLYEKIGNASYQKKVLEFIKNKN